MLFLKGRQTPHCAVGDQCVLSDALLPRPPFHISPSTPPSRRPVQPPSPRLRQSRRVSGQPASRRAGWRLRGVLRLRKAPANRDQRPTSRPSPGRHPGPDAGRIPASESASGAASCTRGPTAILASRPWSSLWAETPSLLRRRLWRGATVTGVTSSPCAAENRPTDWEFANMNCPAGCLLI